MLPLKMQTTCATTSKINSRKRGLISYKREIGTGNLWPGTCTCKYDWSESNERPGVSARTAWFRASPSLSPDTRRDGEEGGEVKRSKQS